MSFKDLDLLPTYTSVKDNLVDDFYTPVLAEAVKYDRVTGFFNSHSLALVARGLKQFIYNGGKMRLLCGAELSEDDLNTIINSSEIAQNISDNFLEELGSLYDDVEKNHIKLLAWMLDNDILEIKIGIVKNELGYTGGILHEKTGILLDNDDNTLLFSGSNNETKKGWSSGGYGNIEKFKVFLSWEDSKYMDEDIKSFEDDWNNKNEFLDVIDVPKAAKEGLIKLAPDTIDELMVLPLSYSEKRKFDNKKDLRDYQEEAISKWFENGKQGIFEMATGTGKTFTALNCISKLLKEHEELLTIIACPYAHLVEQWAAEVENFLDVKCYRLYASGNSKWKKDLADLIFDFDLGVVDKAIILTTHNTFSGEFFINEISNVSIDSLLIVDEVHHVASSSFSLGLLNQYDYRLGLSATPYVHNNDEATDLLLNYFNGIVFTYGLKEALTPQEDDDSYLTPYDYFPKRVILNIDEMNEYSRLSKKIARLSHFNQEEMSDSYKTLLIQRKNIINNAEAKYDCLRDIIRLYDGLEHLIVFCSPQQIKKVLVILEEEGVKPHKFTKDEGTRKEDRFGGLSQREYLVEKFDEGYFKALVAIRCLDEGVDIPSAEKVIIMSSSTNPKEYIQRRGRVLRRSYGKEKAEIYDMTVIQKDEYGDLIESITNPEKLRLMDFINLCDNPGYCMDLLEKWRLII